MYTLRYQLGPHPSNLYVIMVCLSETSVRTYKNIWCSNPEYHNIKIPAVKILKLARLSYVKVKTGSGSVQFTCFSIQQRREERVVEKRYVIMYVVAKAQSHVLFENSS